ncbi:hypothetical protein M2403_004523 [Rahnella sp. BIGb0603]|uniref:phage regulatory CII family protein n=1 Tax=Rahnella sp. BIGb0603 TaxID=2940612 RepID=UPI002167120E|nr:phage regulatory CII family protein [Rahnella sp. BIGb0603]MCS3425890.1 hypothetical protein [Rahnella sp. BIGb0603]
MFDYRESKQPHFDLACVSFVKKHNVTDLANKMGVSAQVLRNKLNPDQAHNLSCQELLSLTDLTEDPTLLDGLLAQLQCMPAVPVNELSDGNIANYTLHAAAAVGALANSAVSPERQSRQVKNSIIESVNAGIRHLSLIGLAMQGRVEASPALASVVGAVASVATNGMV